MCWCELRAQSEADVTKASAVSLVLQWQSDTMLNHANLVVVGKIFCMRKDTRDNSLGTHISFTLFKLNWSTYSSISV